LEWLLFGSPFVAMVAFILYKIMRVDESLLSYKSTYLDPNFIQQSPGIALGQAKEEVLKMGQLAIKGLEETSHYIHTNQLKYAETAYRLEEIISSLDRKISDYLFILSTYPLSSLESKEHSILINTVQDIVRIGDHFEYIIELVRFQNRKKAKITKQAIKELNDLFSLTIHTVQEAIKSLDQKDIDVARKVIERENQMVKMERMLKKQHILRLKEGLCTGSAGIVFEDIISNLERIGDHAVNIAESVLEVRHS
jgi:phosphate:Na+ symporter